VNQAAFPDVVATAQHGWDLVRALHAAGHDVTVIGSRSRYGDRGAAFPESEVAEGILIRRVRASRFGRGRLAAQALDAAAFLLGACWQALRLPRADLCICLTTPPFVAIIGWVLARLRGTPYILWSMDLYPDVPVALGVLPQRSIMARILYGIEQRLLRGAARVVVLGRCMEHRLLEKGLAVERIARIHIWAPRDHGPTVDPDYRTRWEVGDRLLVAYAGNFGLVHDLDPIIDTVIRLGDHPDIRFAFIGEGPLKAELVRRLRVAGVKNWVEAGYQPREALAALLTAPDLHLASLHAGFEGLAVPSKVLGAMAVGRPVIYVGAAVGECARVIAESGGGAVVPNGDAAALADVLVRYAADRESVREAGARARTAVDTQWSTGQALAAWTTLVETIGPTAQGPRSPTPCAAPPPR